MSATKTMSPADLLADYFLMREAVAIGCRDRIMDHRVEHLCIAEDRLHRLIRTHVGGPRRRQSTGVRIGQWYVLSARDMRETPADDEPNQLVLLPLTAVVPSCIPTLAADEIQAAIFSDAGRPMPWRAAALTVGPMMYFAYRPDLPDDYLVGAIRSETILTVG